MGTKMHALITGGSSGIGKSLANKLAADGYDVSLIARRPQLLAQAAEEIRRHGRGQRVGVFPADVTDRAQAEAAVKAAIAEFGPPDMVVTSAGISEPGYFSDLPPENFERAMDINYFGTLYIIRAALPAMRARKRGRIVLVSSGAAFMGIFGYSSYGPSKFAVRGLAETLRAELRADNVGVFVAYPPDTETPMLEAEMKIAPAETRAICALAKTWTADAVADSILKGIKRGAFAITPGATLTLMHRLPGTIIPLLRWYSDRLVKSVRKSSQRSPLLQTELREPAE
jgi:3-dehydrosphinganine reductase